MNRKHPKRLEKGQPESEEETGVSAMTWNPREANASRRLTISDVAERRCETPFPTSAQDLPQLSPIGIPCE